MGGEDCKSQEIVEAGESSPTEVAPGWVIEMENEREGRSLHKESERWKEGSIYMIPASLKRLQRRAYQPQVVSIGPYHHGEAQLKGMEEHKKRALLAFLKRSKKPLKYYVDALAPVEQDLKKAYPQLQPHFKEPESDRFLKLMILDGCFILELIWIEAAEKQELKKAAAYAKNDPVFGDHGKLYFLPPVQRDMLMLENQLPLLVLLKLDGDVKKGPLTQRILKFFNRTDGIHKVKEFEKCTHILELYRKSMLSPKSTGLPRRKKFPCLRTGFCAKVAGSERGCVGRMIKFVSKKVDKLINEKKKKKTKQDTIRSATELADAGIQFEKSSTTYLDDIIFRKCRGILQLPQITVHALTSSLYRNLMAFERLHVEAGNEVTSYVYFMDRLIDNDKDVRLLHWRGIIGNMLGSDHDVARLFNSVSADVCLDPASGLYGVQDQVCEYYRKPLPRFLAYAKNTYCANFWVTLSIIAALFLFGFTALQTVYTVIGNYKNSSAPAPPPQNS